MLTAAACGRSDLDDDELPDDQGMFDGAVTQPGDEQGASSSSRDAASSESQDGGPADGPRADETGDTRDGSEPAIDATADDSGSEMHDAGADGSAGNPGSDAGAGGNPGMDGGTGGNPGSDAGAGNPGADAGTGGSPGSDAGAGGNPGADAGAGGNPGSDAGAGNPGSDGGLGGGDGGRGAGGDAGNPLDGGAADAGPPDASGGAPCSASCAGCCDSRGECQAGFLDDACGQSGGRCVDCTTSGSTCDVNATPRVCANQQNRCPAAFSGCSGASTPVASPRSVCSDQTLREARSACTAGAHTTACDSFFAFEQTDDATCGGCLAAFDFDYVELKGVFACVSSFVPPSCNDDTGCITQCLDESCQSCPDRGSTLQCEGQAAAGTCASFVSTLSCVDSALTAGGAFCSPVLYPNFGDWLAAVGTRLCGP